MHCAASTVSSEWFGGKGFWDHVLVKCLTLPETRVLYKSINVLCMFQERGKMFLSRVMFDCFLYTFQERSCTAILVVFCFLMSLVYILDKCEVFL